MAVTSQPLNNGQPTPGIVQRVARHSFLMDLAVIGLVLALIPISIVWWGINGAYSVAGVGVAAQAFGEVPFMFYSLVASWQFRFPVPKAATALALPTLQPVLLWGMVVGATFLEIALLAFKFRGAHVPVWLLIAATLFSAYDFGTTWYGLGLVTWVAQAGEWFQVILAIILTFGLEIILSLTFRLKGR